MSDITYAIDLTGEAEENKITNEEVIIISSIGPYSFSIIPEHAPFYTKDLVIQFHDGNAWRQLNEGVDYVLGLLFIDASRSVGKLVYGAISLRSYSIEGTAMLQYRTVGGQWSTMVNAARNYVANNKVNTHLELWDNLFDKLPLFPAADYDKNRGVHYKADNLASKINELSSTIQTRNNVPVNTPHLSIPNNPHHVSLESLGYELCTEQEIAINAPVDKFLTYNQAALIASRQVFYIETPSISGLSQIVLNNTLQLRFQSSPFLAINYNDRHFSSNWQLSTSSDFLELVASVINEESALLEITIPNLLGNTIYYARVCYRGSSGRISAWSPTVTALTQEMPISVNRPIIISPIYGVVQPLSSFLCNASDFKTINGEDTHLSSDWQLADTSDFTTLISETTDDNLNKTSWPLDSLLNGKIYYLRVRFTSTEYRKSDWSPVAIFKMKDSDVSKPSILTPINDAIDQPEIVSYSSTLFESSDINNSHLASIWQLSTQIDFSSLFLESIYDPFYKTEWVTGGLISNQRYYVRVKYIGSAYQESEWSDIITFIESNR